MVEDGDKDGRPRAEAGHASARSPVGFVIVALVVLIAVVLIIGAVSRANRTANGPTDHSPTCIARVDGPGSACTTYG